MVTVKGASIMSPTYRTLSYIALLRKVLRTLRNVLRGAMVNHSAGLARCEGSYRVASFALDRSVGFDPNDSQ